MLTNVKEFSKIKETLESEKKIFKPPELVLSHIMTYLKVIKNTFFHSASAFIVMLQKRMQKACICTVQVCSI